VVRPAPVYEPFEVQYRGPYAKITSDPDDLKTIDIFIQELEDLANKYRNLEEIMGMVSFEKYPPEYKLSGRTAQVAESIAIHSDNVIPDACCIVNLYASNYIQQIFSTGFLNFKIARYVMENEVSHIYGNRVEAEERPQIEINLKPIIDQGLLAVVVLATPEEFADVQIQTSIQPSFVSMVENQNREITYSHPRPTSFRKNCPKTPQYRRWHRQDSTTSTEMVHNGEQMAKCPQWWRS
jgi:hypothetical protein